MKKEKISKILNDNANNKLIDVNVKKEKEYEILESELDLKEQSIQKTIKRLLNNFDIDENDSK